MRADPARVAAAAGEIPSAGDPVAARHRDPPAFVGRAPGAGRPRRPEHRARRVETQVGGEQADAVSDRNAPADRAVSPRQFLDRQHILARLDLVAADRARVEHAEQTLVVQPVEHRQGQPPPALDCVRLAGDQVGQIPRPRQGRGVLHLIHRPFQALSWAAIAGCGPAAVNGRTPVRPPQAAPTGLVSKEMRHGEEWLVTGR